MVSEVDHQSLCLHRHTHTHMRARVYTLNIIVITLPSHLPSPPPPSLLSVEGCCVIGIVDEFVVLYMSCHVQVVQGCVDVHLLCGAVLSRLSCV